MRIINCAQVGLVLLLAGCGGQSDDGGRKAGDVKTNGDRDAGADDDDEGRADDDSDDDASDDDASDDDASDDDASDDDASDDDVSDDDDVKPRPDPVAPPIGSVSPPPTPVGTTPVGTTPVAPADPVPGCSITGQSAGPGYCEVNQQCDASYSYSYCYERSAGLWSCQCSDDKNYRDLEITGTSSPCATAAEVCLAGETPDFSGEATCAIEYQSSNVSSCETQERCTISDEVADGVAVVQSQYNYASCYPDGTGALSCYCNSANGTKQFSVPAASTAQACSLGMDLCSQNLEPDPTSEVTCTIGYESASTGYCEKQQSCGQTVLVDGTEVLITEPSYGFCQSDNAGGANCSCSNNQKSMNFGLDTPIDATTCNTAINVCGSADEVVPEGPVDCALYSQSASAGYCDATIQCSQAATIDGTTIGVNGSLYAYCEPNGDAWACQCQSGSETVALTVDAADAWSACTDVAAQCPDLVDVQIGSNGNPCYAFQSMGEAAAPGAPAVGPAPGGGMAPCR